MLMNYPSLQSRIAQVRHLLAELEEALCSAMPDALPKKNSAQKIPLKKEEDLLPAVEDIAKELHAMRDQVLRHQKLALLRTEMWKAAAEDQVSEEKLIEKLLCLVGPTLNLSRCSFFVIATKKNEAVCKIQWYKDAAFAALSSRMPSEVIRELSGNEYVAVHEKAPAERKQSALIEMLKAYKIKSFLAVPYDDPWSPRGILTFADCSAPRQWTQNEINILLEIANIVSSKSAQIKAEQALIESNARLEHQIKERTAELSAANQKLMEDIGEREKAQNALVAEKELLTITLGSIGEAVITLDAKGNAVLFNKAAESLTGCSFEEVAGKPIEKALSVFDEKNHAEPCTGFIERCLAGADGEQANENRCMIRSRNGKEHIIAFQGSRIKEQGEYLGSVLVLRDITQSYFLEEELLKIRKLESVGVLAGGIAHDFNNLLTGITTYLFMARMSVAGNKDACSLITEAEKAAFKASTLTKQLLSFSKGGPSVKENASIKQMIQDTVGFCLSGSNVDYRLEIPEDLATVDVDKGQIDQAFNNLILNAVQAMPDGGTLTISAENFLIDETGSLTVSSKTIPLQAGRYVKVSVKDEGLGIPHEHLDRLFDPYFTTKKDGTGLGLTTAYSIVKKHGGHIYVESTQGKGSVFTFFLPASTNANGRTAPKESMLPFGTGKVLIMDDDVIVRTVVETLLKKAGYSAVCAADGAQALSMYKDALARNEPITVTIMDLTIPGGMGGKETVKQLRDIDPSAKVIVFSGYSNDPIFTNFREFGFDGVLSKPFSIEEFMRTIVSVLHGGESPSGHPSPGGS